MSSFANFFFEVGMLARTPRSGFPFLGTGEQSVAEHVHRMLNVAFILARLSEQPVDELHLLHLVLFHDLPETRTGDFNYVNHKYDRVNEDKLYADLEKELPFGEEIVKWIREFEARLTPEARLANDADQLELIATLKEQQDLGNARAADWIASARARLKTAIAQQLAEELLTTPSDEWWDVESGGCDAWFVEPHDNDGRLIAKVWTEVSQEPVCPLDAFTLKSFCVMDR